MVVKLGKVKYCVKEIYREADTTQKEPGGDPKARPDVLKTNEDQKQRGEEEDDEDEEMKVSAIDHNAIQLEEERPAVPSISPNIDPAKARQDTSDKPTCRICQTEDNTPDNPMISPCKCSGSIKFIHVKCMQEWYKSKMLSRVVQNTSSYTIKGLECELCKQKFSMTIEHNGKLVDLVNVARPKTGAYIVLESVGQSNVTHIHITAMENKHSIRIVFLIEIRVDREGDATVT